MTDLDVLIIGGGTAGEQAAGICLDAGLSTGIVERGRVGGACIFNACIPTKAMVHAARAYKSMRSADRFGLPVCERAVDYGRVKAFKDGVIEGIAAGRAGRWQERGAQIIEGEARFRDPHEVLVGDEVIRAERIIITTGSVPAVPPIPGLKEAGFLTNAEALGLERVPGRLAIIGGGPVGLEFAQIFSAFGSEIRIYEAANRVLAMEDASISELVEASLTRDGVVLSTGAVVERVESTGAGKLVVARMAGGGESSDEFDEILVATGRRPAIEGLNLEAAGVQIYRGGITTDDSMCTNIAHIWAAGDVTGIFLFTLIAWEQGAVAAANATGKGPRTLNYDVLPRVTFCDPEVASVGMTEGRAREDGLEPVTGRFDYADLSLGIAAAQTEGFCKVVAEAGSGRILGGHIAGVEAASLIHEVAAAMAEGMTARQVGDTLHAYPTFSEAVRYACQSL